MEGESGRKRRRRASVSCLSSAQTRDLARNPGMSATCTLINRRRPNPLSYTSASEGFTLYKASVQTFFVRFTGGGRGLAKPLVHSLFQTQDSENLLWGPEHAVPPVDRRGQQCVGNSSRTWEKRVGERREEEGCPELRVWDG